MEKFKPSIDWVHEAVTSAQWIVVAWAISATAVLVVCGVLGRHTTWGERFWRITGDYFTGRASTPVWGALATLLLSVIVEVRLQVLLSYYNNDLFSALQVAFQGAGAHDSALRDSGVHGFWLALATFCILATLRITRIVFDTYLTQRFLIRWRVWLTDRLTGDWLAGRAYYRARFTEAPIDNPDQRIQEDIDVFTAGVGSGPNAPSHYSQTMLIFGAVNAVVSTASFTVILWRLSGPLTLFGIEIPKALFCIVVVYVLIVTLVAFWIGRPLIRLSFRNEQTNAAFRYALVRLRDAAESVAFYRGERAERAILDDRFSAIISNYRRFVRRTIGLIGWNFSATEAIIPLPFLLQAPRLFAGSIKLGDVTQSATAFGKISSGLSFFRNAFSQFAGYNAAIIRLHGLVETSERARELPTLTTTDSPDGSVELRGVEVNRRDGGRLIAPIDLRLEPGESMVISGGSGTGKTTLLRSLAQGWPAAGGEWLRPAGPEVTMFVSQLPYVPLGDLRAVVSYPLRTGETADERLREVLDEVFLSHLANRLDEQQDWAAVLSPGEQQRIAFARVMLARPKALLLDEATSALDETLESELYGLLRRELPDTIVVSVAHRDSVDHHHQRRLTMLEGGAWHQREVLAAIGSDGHAWPGAEPSRR